MSNEITHNYTTGLNLYFCCFQQDGDVFLTGGASDEVWGTGGHTADAYDEAMTEEASSGHYKGSIAAGVGAGVYQIAVYLRAGANPADADIVIAQGEIYWDGTAEINLHTMTGADGDTLETLSDQIDDAQTDIDTIVANTGKVVNVYPDGEKKVITGGANVGYVEDERL